MTNAIILIIEETIRSVSTRDRNQTMARHRFRDQLTRPSPLPTLQPALPTPGCMACPPALLAAGRAGAEDDIYWFPPQRSGGATARLGVRIADSAAAVPVTLFVVVEGPRTLETEPARLGESVGAWEATTSFRWFVPPKW